MLAGPNGCGKSCVLDAIRLVKSAYGSYQQDEWQSWFGEFAINVNAADASVVNLLQKRSKPLEIVARFELSSDELAYIESNLENLLHNRIASGYFERNRLRASSAALALAANQRQNRKLVDAAVAKEVPNIRALLKSQAHLASLRIDRDGSTHSPDNPLLELLFSTYEPQTLGVIDYHGAHRTYNRENLGSINLTIEATTQKQRQHALYGYTNKYNNLKSEMGGAYVRHLLGKEASPGLKDDDSLTSTLKELFSTFFPGKEFLGPKPTTDGKLLFPVKLSNGSEHDIDELSSGEKEVLYGYLRLHNDAPRQSMILIDEPELHLNPRLIRGLAEFYYKNLGDRLGNQLVLVTHSDALISEAVGSTHYSVYHVQPATTAPGSNQASQVSARDDLDRLILDLVGDLAVYRPGARLVIFESTEDAEFDARMTGLLFPELPTLVNTISAGNKKRVNDLYEMLAAAQGSGKLGMRFFGITDQDDEPQTAASSNRFTWDRYHIENYLLEARFILLALRDVGVTALTMPDEKAVEASLEGCANDTVPTLVLHRLTQLIYPQLRQATTVGADPQSRKIGDDLAASVDRSAKKLTSLASADLSSVSLTREESRVRNQLLAEIKSGQWRSTFRGRDVLRRFAGRHVQGMGYEYFRDLIVSRMRDAGYRPAGMEAVVAKVLAP